MAAEPSNKPIPKPVPKLNQKCSVQRDHPETKKKFKLKPSPSTAPQIEMNTAKEVVTSNSNIESAADGHRAGGLTNSEDVNYKSTVQQPQQFCSDTEMANPNQEDKKDQSSDHKASDLQPSAPSGHLSPSSSRVLNQKRTNKS